jgi:hypothetical protein
VLEALVDEDANEFALALQLMDTDLSGKSIGQITDRIAHSQHQIRGLLLGY